MTAVAVPAFARADVAIDRIDAPYKRLQVFELAAEILGANVDSELIAEKTTEVATKVFDSEYPLVGTMQPGPDRLWIPVEGLVNAGPHLGAILGREEIGYDRKTVTPQVQEMSIDIGPTDGGHGHFPAPFSEIEKQRRPADIEQIFHLSVSHLGLLKTHTLEFFRIMLLVYVSTDKVSKSA